MDINLREGMNGIEAIRQITKTEPTAKRSDRTVGALERLEREARKQ